MSTPILPTANSSPLQMHLHAPSAALPPRPFHRSARLIEAEVDQSSARASARDRPPARMFRQASDRIYAKAYVPAPLPAGLVNPLAASAVKTPAAATLAATSSAVGVHSSPHIATLSSSSVRTPALSLFFAPSPSPTGSASASIGNTSHVSVAVPPVIAQAQQHTDTLAGSNNGRSSALPLLFPNCFHLKYFPVICKASSRCSTCQRI